MIAPGEQPRAVKRPEVRHVFHHAQRALVAVREGLVECSTCGNVDTSDPCSICADPRRDARSLCVVEDVADLWALDRARLFTGR
ncbi:MAG: recombination protein RecR, partial [Novosphingobium sp.]